MLISELGGRDVAILGVGREGLAAWKRLRADFPGQTLSLYSEAPVSQDLSAGLSPLDALHIGPLDGDRLAQHEVLIRSPGISPYRAPLRLARSAGVAVTSGTNLWLAENPGARTLCITGTKGKSTTTALLHHLLSAAGGRVALAGNIGVPLIACDPGAADWWVVELSSYQLCDLEARPWLSLLLNLSDEHLDWHGGAERYRHDKLRLARLTPKGRLVANGGQATFREALADRPDTHWFNVPGGLEVRDGVLWDEAHRLPPLPGAPGRHNLENLAGALTVCDLIGLRPEPLAPALATFQGLPHRQRLIGERDGLRFVDDSLSTTPVATLAALETFREAQAIAGDGRCVSPDSAPPVTVLVGGLDRGIDWAPHAVALARAGAHALVGIPDSGPSIIDALQTAGLAPAGGLHLAESMQAALEIARRVTPAGGVVLLSPGAPSFPVYRDYAARAAAFAEATGVHSESEAAGSQG